ncbi:MAG: hypothetical protein ABI337_06650 [Nitrososphaera sp.]
MAVLQRLLYDASEVRGWGNKKVGMGLRESDFDKFQNCSRRIFNSRKKRFLKLRLIEYIDRKKGKRDKFYKITPLGVMYYFQNTQLNKKELTWFWQYASKLEMDRFKKFTPKIGNENLKKAFIERSETFYNEILQDIKSKLPSLPIQTLINAATNAIACITINQIENEVLVHFTPKLPRDISIPIYSFTLKEKSVTVNYSPFETSSSIISYDVFYNMLFSMVWDHILFEFAMSDNDYDLIKTIFHFMGFFPEELIYEYYNILEDSLHIAVFGQPSLRR